MFEKFVTKSTSILKYNAAINWKQRGDELDFLTFVFHIKWQVKKNILGAVNLVLKLGLWGKGQIRILQYILEGSGGQGWVGAARRRRR